MTQTERMKENRKISSTLITFLWMLGGAIAAVPYGRYIGILHAGGETLTDDFMLPFAGAFLGWLLLSDLKDVQKTPHSREHLHGLYDVALGIALLLLPIVITAASDGRTHNPETAYALHTIRHSVWLISLLWIGLIPSRRKRFVEGWRKWREKCLPGAPSPYSRRKNFFTRGSPL